MLRSSKAEAIASGGPLCDRDADARKDRRRLFVLRTGPADLQAVAHRRSWLRRARSAAARGHGYGGSDGAAALMGERNANLTFRPELKATGTRASLVTAWLTIETQLAVCTSC